ncbi:MAG: hypothetical protein LBT40_09040 [Deltaproteobacteria bacterium]|nr:hypothetical protein [Deltaproteobacteria bacterium]
MPKIVPSKFTEKELVFMVKPARELPVGVVSSVVLIVIAFPSAKTGNGRARRQVMKTKRAGMMIPERIRIEVAGVMVSTFRITGEQRRKHQFTRLRWLEDQHWNAKLVFGRKSHYEASWAGRGVRQKRAGRSRTNRVVAVPGLGVRFGEPATLSTFMMVALGVQ